MSLYPECDKLSRNFQEHQTIMSFLEWCSQNGLELRDWNNTVNDMAGPISKPLAHVAAEYHDIDMNKVEEERTEMLNAYKQTLVEAGDQQ